MLVPMPRPRSLCPVDRVFCLLGPSFHVPDANCSWCVPFFVQSGAAEKAGLTEQLVLAEERQLELEAEVRGLKAAVVDAQTNAEQLEEMSR